MIITSTTGSLLGGSITCLFDFWTLFVPFQGEIEEKANCQGCLRLKQEIATVQVCSCIRSNCAPCAVLYNLLLCVTIETDSCTKFH